VFYRGGKMGSEIIKDSTWFAILSTETKPTKQNPYMPNGEEISLKNSMVCVEVDTGTAFIFYNGIWYEQ